MKEKFQQLQKVISILGDEEKRAIYDQTGCVDDAVSTYAILLCCSSQNIYFGMCLDTPRVYFIFVAFGGTNPFLVLNIKGQIRPRCRKFDFRN